MANPGDDNYLSNRDGMQVLRAAFDDNTKRLRTDSTFTGTVSVDLDSTNDSVAIGNTAGTDFLAINPDGSANVKVTDGTDTLEINPDGSINTVIDGEVSIEISAADGDNIAIANQAGTQFLAVNADGSINITDNGGSITVDGTVAATQSGAWSVNVNNAAGAAAVNIQDGGNSITVDGPLTDTQLRATPVPVSGTVTANAGTNLNTSALALDTSVTGLQVSQSSTTSGEKGPLVQGAVTTAAPTYTTGQTNPLSLTTSGALRTDSSGSTQPVSGTVNAKAATPTAGTITQAAITVGTTAVRATVSGAAPSATRSVLLVGPDSASTAKFYMGTSTVTNSGATRGFQLLGGDQVAFNSDAGDYYIISDTAGQTVYILEQV